MKEYDISGLRRYVEELLGIEIDEYPDGSPFVCVLAVTKDHSIATCGAVACVKYSYRAKREDVDGAYSNAEFMFRMRDVLGGTVHTALERALGEGPETPLDLEDVTDEDEVNEYD